MIGTLTLSGLARRLSVAPPVQDVAFHGVHFDSRRCVGGDLFVALPGDRVDGHDFVTSAAQQGAVAALAERPVAAPIPVLVVPDTRQALGVVGAANRERFPGPVVGITGSCGKTTARALIASILAQARSPLATEGNYNNELGVPLTLARLDDRHDCAVIEMGAAGIGHIAYLAGLVRPTVSVLLNAMEAHLDGFGSLEGVAEGKGEIFDGLGRGDVAVVNADQRWAQRWRERAAPARILDFGLAGPAAVTAADIELLGLRGSRFRLCTPAGEIVATLRIPGGHNVANALAAAAAGLACDISLEAIAAGLAAAEAVDGRLRIHYGADGSAIVDDSYNANPGSVRAAIDLLAATPGRSCLVLGEMLELGDDSAAMHRDIGEHARRAGLAALVGVGRAVRPATEAFGPGALAFDTRESAAGAAPRILAGADTVLIKGSRSSAMEEVLTACLAVGGTAAGDASC